MNLGLEGLEDCFTTRLFSGIVIISVIYIYNIERIKLRGTRASLGPILNSPVLIRVVLFFCLKKAWTRKDIFYTRLNRKNNIFYEFLCFSSLKLRQ